ncbi:hypothetical protein [Natronococcus roseus]|uniref:hypothetical protein n=1 Tax=Natronococcus roseus TaxID=1052014 RepID=UPI00374DB95B
MKDAPEPAPKTYEVSDKVRVYLGETDPDAPLHNTRAVVVDRFTDHFGKETGRALDAYSYRLQDDSGKILEVQFRHSDLVPLINK